MTITVSPAFKLNVLAQASGVPAWFTSLGVSQWSDMGVHPDATTLAFSSTIINTVGLYIDDTFRAGTWIVTFGGGHASTTNNAVYAWGPMEATTPVWNQLSPYVFVAEGLESHNGYPPSPHSYDSLNFLPGRNWMVAGISGANFQNSGGSRGTWVFDFNVPNPMDNNPWTRAGENVGTHEECCSTYDSVADLIFQLRSTTNMGYFVPGTAPGAGVWNQYIQGTGFLNLGCNATFHPSRLMVMAPSPFNGANKASLSVVNLVTSARQFLAPSGTQPPIITQNDHAAIQWVPSQNKFALFPDSLGSGVAGNRSVWWVTTGSDPTTLTGWSYTVETPSGGVTPVIQHPSGQGLYDRLNTFDNGVGLRGLSLICGSQAVARLYIWRLP